MRRYEGHAILRAAVGFNLRDLARADHFVAAVKIMVAALVFSARSALHAHYKVRFRLIVMLAVVGIFAVAETRCEQR
jgi:hypothetical protein